MFWFCLSWIKLHVCNLCVVGVVQASCICRSAIDSLLILLCNLLQLQDSVNRLSENTESLKSVLGVKIQTEEKQVWCSSAVPRFCWLVMHDVFWQLFLERGAVNITHWCWIFMLQTPIGWILLFFILVRGLANIHHIPGKDFHCFFNAHAVLLLFSIIGFFLKLYF